MQNYHFRLVKWLACQGSRQMKSLKNNGCFRSRKAQNSTFSIIQANLLCLSVSVCLSVCLCLSISLSVSLYVLPVIHLQTTTLRTPIHVNQFY